MNQANDYIYHKDETFPDLPFDIKLSLAPVFAFWENKAQHGTTSEQIHAKSILEGVAHIPELRESIDDLDFISHHSEEIRSLLSAIFPEILTNNEIKAASLPFYPVLFNRSNRLTNILANTPEGFRIGLKGFDHDEVYMLACAFLIGVMYRVPINFKRPLYFDIPDVKTGTVRHYRVMINGDFSAIKPKANFRPLSQEDIQLLVDNSHDIDLWKKMIPPRSATYEGLAIITLFDQTEEEALSELKHLLLKNNALRDEETLIQLQSQLAQYLGVEKVELGFEAFDEAGGSIKALYGAARPSKLLGDAFETAAAECLCDYSFDALINKRDSFAVSDVRRQEWAPSAFIKHMSDVGVGSFIVAPLKYNEKIVAFIEITSPKPGVLNSMVANKLKNVLPMFTVAVGRSLDQHQTQLEAIIQDKFTSIHPAVTWKFFKAAENIFIQQQSDTIPEMPDISFQDVYPLYGQFDIRGSSDARNASIKEDLLQQLKLAEDVIRFACRNNQMPIYKQLLFRVNQYKGALSQAIHAGDEVRILDFIKRELDPVFDFVEKQEGGKALVKKYRDALDPELGVLYEQRKQYEKSVTLINERICDYIDQQQVLAQNMFPHYFEKYKTDGVEFNAYIGESLVQSREFHPLYLRNLRLWQLLITCGVENMHQVYKGDLPMPLPITSLILVHSNPLAIRFRMDEKRFDVDGAYNIRYEILKKRIDKAYIKGTTERLTQPGKLAIVYSQDWEADEYLQYIQYLQSIDYLDDNLERLELQDLQGTSGLQAFRVGFKYEVAPDVLIREMMQEVNN
jgi:hypothetical protein